MLPSEFYLLCCNYSYFCVHQAFSSKTTRCWPRGKITAISQGEIINTCIKDKDQLDNQSLLRTSGIQGPGAGNSIATLGVVFSAVNVILATLVIVEDDLATAGVIV